MIRTVLAVVAALLLVVGGCGDEPDRPIVPYHKPMGGLTYAYVDVAKAMGYTMLNRSGNPDQKNYLFEAMPPGIAVADFNGDGWYDLYCPNGNNVDDYDPKTGKVTMIPVDKAPRNELYWNREGKRFEAGGKAAGVDDHLWAFGAIAGDVDNDGDPDLYVCNWGANRLYLNDGKGKFVEVGGQVGVAGGSVPSEDWSTGACFVDIDNDGDLDLYVAQYADAFDLVKRFTKLEGGRLTGRQCNWKGLKVYCGPHTLRPSNDVVFKNLLVETGELKFQDITKKAGLWFKTTDVSYTKHSKGPFYGFQPVAWDINGDGWQDIFVANDSHVNNCWINQKDGTFQDDAARMGLALGMSNFEPQASMGIAVADFNLDGEFDITMTEFSHDEFNLLLGERFPSGLFGFNETAAKSSLRNLTFLPLGWGALFIDPDLDGDTDIFYACGHVFPEVANLSGQDTHYKQMNILIENVDPRRLKMRNVSALAGPGLLIQKCSRGAVVVDFDNDGDPDIATTEHNDLPSLLRCDLDPAQSRHWLAVRVIGNPSKKVTMDAAGAVVTVKVGDLTIKKLVVLGSSFMSSEDPRLLFGLNQATTADWVEVAWPNGQKTRLDRVLADRLLTIRLR